MNLKNYLNIKLLIILFICVSCSTSFSQNIYTNDMDYVLGDTKQAFITNQISTTAQADNLLLGFKKMKVNGIRIPVFGRDLNGVDLNPNKPMMDYFYTQALAQGFDIFANPAQGGGGKRIANNRLNGNGATEGADASVNGVQAATDELIARMLEFSAEYPDCKWLNPFNEDGRATSSTWSVNQINSIYAALYNNVNGAELIGPCTWGLPAAIDMFDNSNTENYITVAASHNLGFNHTLWDDFIALADAKNLPVWDSEVNHNDAKGNGTRLEKAIEYGVDGLVLYNSWTNINLNSGAVNNGGETMMALYLKQQENLALSGAATQSSTGFNMSASKAIDGDISGSYSGGNGSISLTGDDGGGATWWQVDLGQNTEIGSIKIFGRTDSCCKNRMSDYTVSVINSNGTTVFSERLTEIPDQAVIVETGSVTGQIVKIELHAVEALALAEVQVFASESGLSVDDNENIQFTMFPNPVLDKLTVIAPNTEIDSYTLFTINGQIVHTNKSINTSSKIEIDLSDFVKGIYLLKLNGGNYSKTFKVVKQ